MTSSDVAIPTTSGSDLEGLGLEDASVTDIVIPRLRIMHPEGLFQDNLSQAEYPKLTVIVLGLIKQRVKWADEVDDDDRPMCKSTDFEHGFPNIDEAVKKDKRFPWDASNFKPEDFPADKGINGLTTLPCAQCNFKEWQADRKPPTCSEQHTYPILYNVPDTEDWIPALFTVQRTGIKPSRNYLSAFVQSRKPMFTATTEIGLTQQSRGTVKYSIPTFKRTGNSDPDLWEEYANTFRAIRDFVKQPPRPQEDDEAYAATEGSSNVNAAPAPAATQQAPPAEQVDPMAAPAQAPSAATEPAAASAPAPAAPQAQPVAADDDDLPF